MCVHLKCHHHIMALSSVCVSTCTFLSTSLIFPSCAIVLTGVADRDT